MYVVKLDDIFNKYNTYYSTIKMNPVDFNKENNKKDPKFEVGDYVRISKYKNIFAKGYTPNWPEEVFMTEKIKNTVLTSYVISDLNG